ncbi:cytochrome b-245 light chain-like [Mizuhopecten yessoensis]|uniref:cytochrome b-245 light chain-like n=1 Tax=Mizuhopecten yessoensis TaxID=6573 RepID=UPI000B457A9E|nr:cytochrome b-245 light chain-like [Mizuhopecten yessoensis]
MRQIEWAMWANEQAIASAFILISGGAIGVAGFFKGWEIGIYGIVAGIFVLMIEYPRGKRKTGHSTQERTFQRPLSRLLNCCGPVTRNYFVRFIIYLVLCVPACFILATLLGGVCLFITSMIYMVAAFRGEEWLAVGLEEKEADPVRELKSFKRPVKPPPRFVGHVQEEEENRV